VSGHLNANFAGGRQCTVNQWQLAGSPDLVSHCGYWNIRCQWLSHGRQGVAELFETSLKWHALLHLSLEVSNDVFWIHTWRDGYELPAVFTPRVKDLLGGVSKDWSGCIFPFLHGPILNKSAPARVKWAQSGGRKKFHCPNQAVESIREIVRNTMEIKADI